MSGIHGSRPDPGNDALVLQRFGINNHGRDFVVGDVHGCFDLLQQALDAHAFAPERDRLFCVGDLVDRGPASADALWWLNHTWFHACMGNHEEMLLRAEDPDELFVWMINGGGWWMQQDPRTQSRFRAVVAELPLAMEVSTPFGTVGIVHADVPQEMTWPEFIQSLERADPRTRAFALWGRARAEGLIHTGVTGIDRVVCGHTIMHDARVHAVGNVWFIDTGAFRTGRLSLLPMEDLFRAQDRDGIGA